MNIDALIILLAKTTRTSAKRLSLVDASQALHLVQQLSMPKCKTIIMLILFLGE